ncbi:MAG: M50 family metallopeptidase, partial [Actinomycetota bacterium]
YEVVAPEDIPRTFGAKPIWQRALVIVAGPATHFFLAFLFFSLWLGAVGEPTTRSPMLVEVPATLDGAPGPAFEAGLRPGDRIVAIDGMQDPRDDALIAYVQDHVGQAVIVAVEREERTLTVTIIPVLSEVDGVQQGRLGVVLGPGRRDRTGVVGAMTGGVQLVGEQLVATVQGVGRIFGPEGLGRLVDLVFTDEPRAPGDATSVVGVGAVAGTIASEGHFGDLLFVFGIVNVFVGFLNLLPLPPFDGGHLAVLAIEKVRGRPVDMRKVVPVSAAVAAFFILFTVAVVYVDIVKPPV